MRSLPATARPRLVVLAAIALILAGCATTGPPRAPFARILIINDSVSMVTIYALPGGSRIRLGQVRGISEQEFDIHRRHLDGSGQLRLLVDPLGSPRQYPTDFITVVEGDMIEFRVSSFIR